MRVLFLLFLLLLLDYLSGSLLEDGRKIPLWIGPWVELYLKSRIYFRDRDLHLIVIRRRGWGS